ncbi:DUF5320 family protein [Marinifilum sp.]|uniref:DUF5320 family protein n=1 Tax=Marinifilum sp. TaxID=2033137 RepID=UPI003BAC5855
MPKLDGTGNGGQGSNTGRKLGKCTSENSDSLLKKLGKGLGLRCKSGGGSGRGKRLKSGM